MLVRKVHVDAVLQQLNYYGRIRVIKEGGPIKIKYKCIIA